MTLVAADLIWWGIFSLAAGESCFIAAETIDDRVARTPGATYSFCTTLRMLKGGVYLGKVKLLRLTDEILQDFFQVTRLGLGY